jgi:RecA-family ATPase
VTLNSKGQTGILVDCFSIGKTLFSLQLTISLTTGRDFLERRIDRPYRVAFIDIGDGASEIKSRIGKQVSSILTNKVDRFSKFGLFPFTVFDQR